MSLVSVAIALGSNLGDRLGHLEWAIEQLRRDLTDLRVSTVIETAPVDVPDEQPPFLNAVVTGRYEGSAQQLLHRLHELEAAQGRTRTRPRAARTLDLDLILFGDLVLHQPGFEVPHPRFRERQFVLEPLAEIAPGWVDPVTGRTIQELRSAL
jgi:2-amino-4-hydroxy-6-hydroxymethyldihydropteridine diphosphokinase